MDISGKVIWMLQSTNSIPSVPSSSKIWAMACIYMVASTPALWPSISSFKKVDMVLPISGLKTSLTPISRIPKFLSSGISVNLVSADFWSTQLFLLCLFLFILSSCLDSRKLFRIYVYCRGRRGKFADQNIAGSFFLSRNTWSIILIESDRDLRKTCICKKKWR